MTAPADSSGYRPTLTVPERDAARQRLSLQDRSALVVRLASRMPGAFDALVAEVCPSALTPGGES